MNMWAERVAIALERIGQQVEDFDIMEDGDGKRAISER